VQMCVNRYGRKNRMHVLLCVCVYIKRVM